MGKTIWITGLSGAGKTTIGRALHAALKKDCESIVILDGDELRRAIAPDVGYSLEERKKAALRFAGICKLLSDQDLTVICCTVSMFDEIRDWNHANIENYVEVYIKTRIETLISRDQKGLYSSGAKNVMGMDLDFEAPKNPDLILENDHTPVEQQLGILLHYLEEHKEYQPC